MYGGPRVCSLVAALVVVEEKMLYHLIIIRVHYKYVAGGWWLSKRVKAMPHNEGIFNEPLLLMITFVA